MDYIKYNIKIENSNLPSGSIDTKTMSILCDLLMKTSKKSLSFFVEGVSHNKGNFPKWINDTSNFIITGLKKGSTVIEIISPQLRHTNEKIVNQGALWNDFIVDGASTGMTFLIKSTNGIKDNEDYYNKGILQSIKDFDKIIGNNGSLTIESENVDNTESAIIGKDCMRTINKLIEEIPIPQTVTISGNLDTIKHSKNMFVLQLSNNKKVHGYVNTDFLDPDALRKYWGKKITLKGKAQYSISGKIQMIEATSIKKFEDGEEILTSTSRELNLFKNTNSKKGAIYPWEYWPEDDNTPLEELLSMLDK